MFQHNAPALTPTQPEYGPAPPYQRQRPTQTKLIEQFTRAQLPKATFARQHNIPRSTLRHWLARKDSIDAEPTLNDFFHTEVGVAFVHRLVTAVHFVFGLLGLASPRLISTFLKLSGLAPFVASSKSTHHKVQNSMFEATERFDQREKRRLASLMRSENQGHKVDISLACDENFHEGVCLVAIESRSNFIFLEEHASDRTAATWILRLRLALAPFPVHLVQVVADGAKALKALAEHFEAHLSPDLMHILQPTVRTLLGSLSSRQAKAGDGDGAESEQERKDGAAGLEKVRSALKQITASYHPIEMTTGHWLCPKVAIERIKAALKDMEAVVDDLGLSNKCRKGLSKTAAKVAEMKETLERAEGQHKELLGELDPAQWHVADVQMRAAYLQKMATSADAKSKKHLNGVIEGLGEGIEGHFEAMEPGAQVKVEKIVRRSLRVFERSSSNVEGRNGHLSRAHHDLHKLSVPRLRALTVVHNFFARRADKTTAAERFFGHKPADLFEYLLEEMDCPAWPAPRKSAT